MKFLIVLAVAIIAVNGKPVDDKDVPADAEFAKNIDELKEELKDVETALGENPGNYVEQGELFLSHIDKEIRQKLMNDAVRNIEIVMDTTRSLAERYHEAAEIAQSSADLWKLAAEKYSKLHPAEAGESTPAPAA